jgi:chitodextrinase
MDRAVTSVGPATPIADKQRPSPPTALKKKTATKTTITVAWRAATDNVRVAGYNLYRGTKQVGTTRRLVATFAGLACATRYTFYVSARDAAGNRSAKAKVAARTAACVAASPSPPPDAQAPTVPAGLAMTSATQSAISVSWSASTDNVGTTGYGVYKNGAQAQTSTTTSAVISGLACGTSYTFAVDAYDAAGNRSAKSVALAASTSSCLDTQAPSVPAGLQVTGVSPTSVSVSWSSSSDNVGVLGYGLYRGGTSVATTSGTSYTFGGLACGMSYTLAVDAYDVAGNRSAQLPVTVSTSGCGPPPPPGGDTQSPTSPGNPAVTAATQTSLSVSWSASSDNVGVAGYGLYRDGTALGSTSSTSYTFSGLSCGTSYALAVDASDAAANRSAKASLSATTSACPAAGSTYYVAVSGNDANSCMSQSSPCQSFNGAYQKASGSSGATVLVAAGSYGTEDMSRNANVTGTNSQIPDGNEVTFKPASGAGTVTIGDLNLSTINGPAIEHLAFEDLTFLNAPYLPSAKDVHFTRCNFRGTNTVMYWVDYVSIRDSDITGTDGDCIDLYPQPYSSPTDWPRNVLIEGNSIHDCWTTDPQAHPDAIAVDAVTNLVLRGNKFFRNLSMNYRGGADQPVTGVVIENNFFGKTLDGVAPAYYTIAPNGDDIIVRYNTIEGDVQPSVSGHDNRQLWEGNIITGTYGNGSCPTGNGTIAQYNVWNSDNPASCGGATNARVSNFSGYFINLNPSAGSDLHLTATATPAIGGGNQNRYPTKDIDGEARPKGGSVDAGADEY